MTDKRVSYADVACDAWSKDFDYSNYVAFATRVGAHVLPEDSYKLLCQAFDLDMYINSK